MVKNGYLHLPIDRILNCSKVEDVVMEASEEWLRRYLYSSSKLYSPGLQIAKNISSIEASRLKKPNTAKKRFRNLSFFKDFLQLSDKQAKNDEIKTLN